LILTYFIHAPFAILLIICGDIEPNFGPLNTILRHHPPNHKRRNSTYFLPNTIKLKPEYQHLAQTFIPHFFTTHPLHLQKTTSHPNLIQFINSHCIHPTPRILYTLIITIHPSPQTCGNTLRHSPHQLWAQVLLNNMSRLPIPPERSIHTPHPIELFSWLTKTSSTLIIQFTNNYTTTSIKNTP
jgi:hypothetical protein